MIEYLRLFLENCFKFVAFIRTNDMEFENRQNGKPTSDKNALGEKQDPDFRHFPRLLWRQGIKFAYTDINISPFIEREK